MTRGAPALRVALDAGPLLDAPTGVGRYTRELARALPLFDVDVRPYAVSLRGRADRDTARWRVPGRLARASWMRFGHPRIERLVGDVDVVHATNFVLPSLGRARGVVTVHDLSFFRDDTFPGGERLRALVPWSVRRAAAVVVPSRAVADETRDRFGLSEERVRVTHEGVASVFYGAAPLSERALARLGIRPPFAIAVGTIEPRKNLLRLLQAWEGAADAVTTWTLAIAGPAGWGPRLPRKDKVVTLGWVGDETLPGLLAAAEFFCYPSVYEGFGLPPLEAMAARTPALVGRYPAAPEVLGEAALLVDPYDVREMTEALVALVEDSGLRRRLSGLGRAQAARYTWERTARSTVDAYTLAMAA